MGNNKPEMSGEIQSCGAVIFNDKGRVLLVEHLDGANHLTGTFGLPSGRPESGESSLDAIVREVREETGLDIEKGEFTKLPTLYRASIKQKDSLKNFIWEVFTSHTGSGMLIGSLETHPQWVEITKVEKLNLLPNVLSAIREARSLNIS